jgi:hypothetical protein
LTGGSRVDEGLFSPRADERLRAARAAKRRVRHGLDDRARDWPPNSPAAINAWLLLVTTKPPTWRDNLVLWEDHPPTLGRANEGFYYPDPLGFWAEIRERSGLEVRQVAHHITDPHRRGQVYEGFWGRTPDGRVVGKAPQHPTTHNLYRDADMLGFLRSAPAPAPAPTQAPPAGP